MVSKPFVPSSFATSPLFLFSTLPSLIAQITLHLRLKPMPDMSRAFPPMSFCDLELTDEPQFVAAEMSSGKGCRHFDGGGPTWPDDMPQTGVENGESGNAGRGLRSAEQSLPDLMPESSTGSLILMFSRGSFVLLLSMSSMLLLLSRPPIAGLWSSL